MAARFRSVHCRAGMINGRRIFLRRSNDFYAIGLPLWTATDTFRPRMGGNLQLAFHMHLAADMKRMAQAGRQARNVFTPDRGGRDLLLLSARTRG